MVIIRTNIELQIGQRTICPFAWDGNKQRHRNVGAYIVREATHEEWLAGINATQEEVDWTVARYPYVYAVLMD